MTGHPGGVPFRRIAGFCHPIRDINIIVPPSVVSSLMSGGLIREGVSFLAAEPFKLTRDAIIRRAGGQAAYSAGGPVSNTLHAMGSAMGGYPRPVELSWLGPYRAGHALIEGDPLASLRRAGVRVHCLPTVAAGPCESVCVVDSASRDTRAILVGPRPLPATAMLPVDDGALLVIALRHLPFAWPLIAATAPAIAVTMADQAGLDEAERAALAAAVAAGALTFVAGRLPELTGAGLLRRDRTRAAIIGDAEVVGTAAGEAVTVLVPGSGRPLSLPVPAGVRVSGSFLGAGDAYTGGYLLARAQGQPPQTAHETGLACVGRVAASPYARAAGPPSLSALYGGFIERQVTDTDAALAGRLRQTCGLTVVTCGQTGVDTQALRVAARYGLAAFALMPSGLRREPGDGSGAGEVLPGVHKLELSSPSYRYCTWANVYAADGTLLLDYAASEGSQETRRAAEVLGRPLLELAAIPRGQLAATVAAWAAEAGVRVLHVAGNRERFIPAASRGDAADRLDAAIRAAAAVLTVRAPRPATHPAPASRPALAQPQAGVAAARLGVPKLAEVADAVGRYLPGWAGPGVTVLAGRSYDLVRMCDLGFIAAALVGSDMVHEYGAGEYDVMAASGYFNCLVARVVPPPAGADGGSRPVLAQYPGLARAREGDGVTLVPVLGAAETWLATGGFRYAVDTWRTGKTASTVGATLGRVYESCSLCLIAHTGAGGSPAAQAGLGFLQWLGAA